MKDFSLALGALLAVIPSVCVVQGGNSNLASFPVVQALPLPDYQVSFQNDGRELARYHFGPEIRRPFVYPIMGPSGRSLTRMGHPRDPVSHSHHNSVWISHNDVDGVSFWDDRSKGQIVHKRVERFEDGPDFASVLTSSVWLGPTNKVLLNERRLTVIKILPDNEWLLTIDLELAADGREITLGKTPFGLIGVRMAKTIGVNDGGGTIRNSEGGVNEAGVFWKPARWVDYSGAITKDTIEGITLMDHPSNPNHPTVFHVRNDGWMGASLTFDGPRVISTNKSLKLRYGLYIHRGMPAAGKIEKRWQEFSRVPISPRSPR